MRGAATHHGQDGTFETLLRPQDLDDPVLWRIAAIVYEADREHDPVRRTRGSRPRRRDARPLHEPDDDAVLPISRPVFSRCFRSLRLGKDVPT
jgi:hypothetical protein